MLDQLNSFNKLLAHYHAISKIHLSDLFKQDTERFIKFHLNLEGMLYDFSKNNIKQQTLNLLLELAHERKLEEQITAMFSGAIINNTEQRQVLHHLLRNNDPDHKLNPELLKTRQKIIDVFKKMELFTTQIHQGTYLGYSGKKIDTIINVGIGGSDLGPSLLCEALKAYQKNNLLIHFISSIDADALFDVLNHLNPETSLFIIATKSFNTQETIVNAITIKAWLRNKVPQSIDIAMHFVAISNNIEAARNFGIEIDNIFSLGDYIGGRYSLFSAIGLIAMLYLGSDNFNQLRAGAYAMDQHFFSSPLSQNLPVIMGLIGIWYSNFYNYPTRVISPYNSRLNQFPAYAQQLIMESNGKYLDQAGNILNYQTSPVIWGANGINAQHAYYQLLHQGTQIIPMDIIVAFTDQYINQEHQDILVANALAQAEALMMGKNSAMVSIELTKNCEDNVDLLIKHKTFLGNRPTNMLILPEISPYYLGMLIALYEHQTFVQGAIWGINSFDQMGVELGKELAKKILQEMKNKQFQDHDSSTKNLIDYYLKK